MNPIRFGPNGRELFGLFQTPPAGTEVGKSVLVCNPFGQEYVRCHRLLRVIGDRLVRGGFHVLRFDFFGTGDSAGEDDEGDLLQWQEDVLSAHAEVSKLSGNAMTSWLGLRLGGSIAAAASLRVAKRPNQLVLWDPVADGAAYIQELEAAHVDGIAFLAHWNHKKLEQITTTSKQYEVMGFPISSLLRQQIGDLSLSTFTAAKSNGLNIFCNKNSADFKQFEQMKTRADVRTRLIPIETHIAWASNEAMNSAIVPAEQLNDIVETLVSNS